MSRAWDPVSVVIDGVAWSGFVDASARRPPDPLGPVRRLLASPTPSVAARQMREVIAVHGDTEEQLLARIKDPGMREATREALRQLEAE